jgi:hypothetical protein
MAAGVPRARVVGKQQRVLNMESFAMKPGILKMLATPVLVGAVSLLVGAASAQTQPQEPQVVQSARRALSSTGADAARTRVEVPRARVGATGVLEGDRVPAGAKRRQAATSRKSELVPGPAVGDELPAAGAVRP